MTQGRSHVTKQPCLWTGGYSEVAQHSERGKREKWGQGGCSLHGHLEPLGPTSPLHSRQTGPLAVNPNTHACHGAFALAVPCLPDTCVTYSLPSDPTTGVFLTTCLKGQPLPCQL